MKRFLKRNIRIIYYFITIILLELIISLVISNNISNNIIPVLLSTTITASLLGMINTKNTIFNKILDILVLIFLGLLYSTHCVFYRTFKIYFSLSTTKLSDQVLSFLNEFKNIIFKNFIFIIIFMIPLIIYIIISKKIEKIRITRKEKIAYLILFVYSILLLLIHIDTHNKEDHDVYDLYHNENIVSLNVKKLGILNAFSLDIYRTIFGFKPKIININIDEKQEIQEEKEEEEITYTPNILELNLNKETYNDNIKTINEYIKNDPGTLKNEYTGLFKGYNLIYITAESFSEIAISKELTPTLYKLTHEGFIFKNFYTPNILSTIGGEFQTLTGLYPNIEILKTWREGTNYFPYGLGKIYKEIGYNTFAFHNNSYVFQDRNKYMLTQGFTNFKACYNGMEKLINCERWPQSDLEMMEKTYTDYINSNEPFLAYYMTVSGHFGYTFDDNSVAYERRDQVINLENLNEEQKGYIATQIELDRALEFLINKLQEANKLDKTVFVMAADHYPYDLDTEEINELSEYQRDETIEINHNALIIWNNQLEDKIITKPCMSSDIIPTVYNLFGINYDSRLLTGKDILSTSTGLAIMNDHSWISDKGKYVSTTNHFTKTTKEDIDENYISTINSMVNNRINISRMIIDTNYYNYLFN